MTMKTKETATRRRFFFGAGAVALAAPVTFAASASDASRGDVETLEARLAALEDANAIRELQRAYAIQVRAEEVNDVVIQIAADRRTATARTLCVVQVESPIEAPGCTLVDMARAQGEGVVRRNERRFLEQTFARRDGLWKIERAELRELG
jgi:hypothetical protein